jgi:hypothetical protein
LIASAVAAHGGRVVTATATASAHGGCVVTATATASAHGGVVTSTATAHGGVVTATATAHGGVVTATATASASGRIVTATAAASGCVVTSTATAHGGVITSTAATSASTILHSANGRRARIQRSHTRLATELTLQKHGIASQNRGTVVYITTSHLSHLSGHIRRKVLSLRQAFVRTTRHASASAAEVTHIRKHFYKDSRFFPWP